MAQSFANQSAIKSETVTNIHTTNTDNNINTNTVNNAIPNNIHGLKRNYEQLTEAQLNHNTNNHAQVSNEQTVNDNGEPPQKKQKLEESSNATLAPIPQASSAFDDNFGTTTSTNNPYIPPTTTNSNNNGYINHTNSYQYKEGKVLKRTQGDLKRYFNSLDEDILKNDLVTKLCQNNKTVMESIRQKMSENTILCKIFIRSLSYDTKDDTVYNMFTKYGNVKEAVIVKDRQTGKSRGFGFITMSNALESQHALIEHRKMIDGREAICNLASKPQGQKTQSSSSSGKSRQLSKHETSSHRSDRNDRSSRSHKRHDSSPSSNSDRYNMRSTANVPPPAHTPTPLMPPINYYPYPNQQYMYPYGYATAANTDPTNTNLANTTAANTAANAAPYQPYSPAIAGYPYNRM